MSRSASEDRTLAAGQRLLAVRKLLGLTQQEFADSLSISLRSEQNYEKGERKISTRALMELARTHRVDPVWVLEGPGEKPLYIGGVDQLNTLVLEKAHKVVAEVIKEVGTPLSDEHYSELVADAYRMLSAPGESADTARFVANAVKLRK